jgi:hypothetical protein
MSKFDLFVFGATSELFQDLVTKHVPWFEENVEHLFLVQRSPEPTEALRAFPRRTVVEMDCADPKAFREGLTHLVRTHAASSRPKQVLSTYGKFSWNYGAKNPYFAFTDDGFQINLGARLQILDAFRAAGGPVRHHLLGSLFASFPYTGDYALCMWYVNQLVRSAEYADVDLAVYNIGGCRTRFWDHARGGPNPFVHDELPTRELFRAAFLDYTRSVKTFYPTFASRIACFLGRRGLRLL